MSQPTIIIVCEDGHERVEMMERHETNHFDCLRCGTRMTVDQLQRFASTEVPRAYQPQGGVEVLVNAMEYRNAANRYLAHHCGMEGREALPSALEDVNQMLRADKIQNRRDFEMFNGSVPHAVVLQHYFWEWLERLGVAEEHYQEIIEKVYSAK